MMKKKKEKKKKKKKELFIYFFSVIDDKFSSGEETRVIPRILGLRSQWKRSEKEWRRLNEAGVTSKVLDAAISSFIIQVYLLLLNRFFFALMFFLNFLLAS